MRFQVSSLHNWLNVENNVKSNIGTLSAKAQAMSTNFSTSNLMPSTLNELGRKRSSNEANHSLLKSQRIDLLDESKLAQPNQNRENLENAQTATEANSKLNVTEAKSHMNSIKESHLVLRLPTKSEMDMFLEDCYSKPFCHCCGSQVQKIVDFALFYLNNDSINFSRQHFLHSMQNARITFDYGH